MVVHHRFKLLKLPYLAYDKVVNEMNIREQYKVATLSKKMQRVVKNSNQRETIFPHVRFHRIISIVFTNDKKRNSFTIRLRPKQEERYPTMAEFQEQFLFFKNIFNISNIDLSFLHDYPRHLELQVIPFLVQENLKVSRFIAYSNYCTPKDTYLLALNQSTNAKQLQLYNGLPGEIQLSVDECPIMNVDDMALFDARWVKIDHMLKRFMNCQKIQLHGCRFRVGEFKLFVQKWMRSPESRVEYVKFQLKNPSQFGSLVQGIEHRLVGQAYIDNVVIDSYSGCFMVEQVTSGKRAIIYNNHGELIFTTKFSLQLSIRPNVTQPSEPGFENDDDEPNYQDDLEMDDFDSDDSEVDDNDSDLDSD
ncbi:unnamed protein product [Caenorhabditis brenneri]